MLRNLVKSKLFVVFIPSVIIFVTATTVEGNDCCEFGTDPVTVCASHPTGQGDQTICENLGGAWMALHDCIEQGGGISTCEPKSAGDGPIVCFADDVTCCAYAGLSCPPVPTVSEWGVVTMSLLIMTVGTVVLRKSKLGTV